MRETKITKKPPSYRTMADQVVRRTMREAFNDYFHQVAANCPRGRTRVAVKAFQDAVRDHLRWMRVRSS